MNHPSIHTFFTFVLDALVPGKKKKEFRRITQLELAVKLRPRTVPNHPYATVFFSYKDPGIKDLIWLLKYHGQKDIADDIAEVVYGAVLEDLSDELILGNFTGPLLVPVPVAKDAPRRHGYNHADALASALVRADNGKTFELADVLQKRVGVQNQAQVKNRKARFENIKGVLSVKNPSEVAGRNIIIVDDVVTTGATIGEARLTLLASGARTVRALAVAH